MNLRDVEMHHYLRSPNLVILAPQKNGYGLQNLTAAY